jgi:hypothetical protein
VLSVALLAAGIAVPMCGPALSKPEIMGNRAGLRLVVDQENTLPVVRVILPGHARSDRSIEVIFPEHVTVRKAGSKDVEHIYLWQPGAVGEAPAWRRNGEALEYEKHFSDGIQMRARATLEPDGVLFRYEFSNMSKVGFDLVWAPTDPRLTGEFHDPRLERTYVHHKNGWALLAANTPARLTMPMSQWLPARYHDSYTWPVPAQLVKRDSDGITSYDNPVPVDEPALATLSKDGRWVVASFSHSAGNVWSNPELTCQHVDESAALPAGGHVVLEVKMLIVRGGLKLVQRKIEAQRSGLE